MLGWLASLAMYLSSASDSAYVCDPVSQMYINREERMPLEQVQTEWHPTVTLVSALHVTCVV